MLFRQVNPKITNISKSLGGMGLYLDREHGFDFCNNCNVEDGGEANVTAIVFGILCAVITVMFVFLAIAHVIRVKQ